MTTSLTFQTVEDELLSTVANEMASEYQDIAKLAATDMTAFMSALANIDVRKRATVKERLDKAVAEQKAKTEADLKVGEVFGGLLLDSFKTMLKARPDIDGKPGDSFLTQAGKLSTVPSIILRIDRADAGKGPFGDATIIIGKVTQAGNSRGGTGRVHKITVTKQGETEAKDYVSMSQAWKTLMPGKPEPTEEVGGKPSKTRKVGIAGLTAAGHVVAS